VTAPARTPVRETSAVWLVAEREIGSKLRSKAFMISTGILLLIALVGVLFSGFSAKNPDPTTIAVTSETAAVAEALQNTKITEVADAAAAEELVRNGDVSVALVPSDDEAFGYSAVFLDGVSNSLLMQLS